MQHFDNQYDKGSVEDKRRLVDSMFPEKFKFENKKVRTTNMNPILLGIANVNRGLRRSKKKGTNQNNDLSLMVLEAGLEAHYFDPF